MLLLKTATFPSSAAELTRLLNECLRQTFIVNADPTSLHEDSYPHLKELNISLDGARLRDNPPRSSPGSSAATPALLVDRLTLNASALTLGPATVDVSLSARTVQFIQAPSDDNAIVLSIDNAIDGKIEISASPSDLEALIAKIAKSEAGKHGVTIESVQLKLRSKGSRSLSAEVNLRARKSFFSASIRITGQLDLDEELNARISGLACTGDGAIATLACGVLKPHLQKLEGRGFPLMSLPLGEIRLRDVQMMAGDELSVTAEFGSIT